MTHLCLGVTIENEYRTISFRFFIPFKSQSKKTDQVCNGRIPLNTCIMSVLKSQAPVIKSKFNGQIVFSFSKELIQMLWAGQRIRHPQGKIQKVQCQSKFKNWLISSVNLLQQSCITVPKTLHKYLWKYLSQLNKPLVWEESFNAFCQSPPNVFGKLKRSILKPVGRLLALNLAWAWKGCFLPSSCIILH